MTCGNQKCKGAPPNFNTNAPNIVATANSAWNNIKEAVNTTNEDPNAWIKKYFRLASDEYWLFFVIIRGIKERRFNSKPTQAPNQEEDEIVNPVPSNSVEKNRTTEKEK